MAIFGTVSYDILHIISQEVEAASFADLKRFGSVNRRLRQAAIPFIFSKLWVKLYRICDEETANEPIAMYLHPSPIRDNYAICVAAREMHIFSSFVLEINPSTLMELMALTCALPNLVALRIGLSLRLFTHIEPIEMPSSSSILHLEIPNVRWLLLADGLPNLSELTIVSTLHGNSVSHYEPLRKISKNLSRLHCSAPANSEMLQFLEETFPHLEHLGVIGAPHPENILGVIPNYQRFKNLSSLTLPGIYWWNLGARSSSDGVPPPTAAEQVDQVILRIEETVINPNGFILCKVTINGPMSELDRTYELDSGGKLIEVSGRFAE